MAAYDITKLDNGFTFSDGTNEFKAMSVCALDETHFIAFYLSDTSSTPDKCFAKVFEFNPSTGQISSIGDYWNRLRLPNVYNNGRAFKIDDTHIIFIGSHPSYAQGNSCIVTVNTSTWAISLALSNYAWDSDTRQTIDVIQYSSTKYLVTYSSTSSNRGRVKLLSVNTSTWAISTLSSISSYFVSPFTGNSSAMLDGTHFVTVYESEGSDGYLSVLEINPSTYEITHLVKYEYDTSSSRPQVCARVDDDKFVIFWSRTSGPTYARVFSINYSTNTISPLGSLTNIINARTFPTIPVILLGNNKFLVSYYKSEAGQYVDIFEVNTSTWNVSSLGKELNFFSSSESTNSGATFERLSDSKFIGFYREPGTPDVGYLTGFNVEPPIVAPTVTTQAVSDITKDSATGNGNITDTGGVNATRRGFCYLQGSSGDPTTANSVVYDDGSFGTGAYTKAITGLSPNTSYRVRAYAVNSAGTSYGSTVGFTTLKADESNFFILF